jgi:hypothetical protein
VTNLHDDAINVQSTLTVNADTVAGSGKVPLSGTTNNAELGMPLHSIQAAKVPQSSQQLATMLH